MELKHFFPLEDQILVERVVDDGIKDGIYIPDSAKDEEQYRVIHSGNHEFLDPNDIVFLRPHAGVKIKLLGKDYLVVKHSEILGAIDAQDI